MTGTQNITILFTDLVGSTELSTSLAPGAADEVRRAHFSLLRQAISTSGGTEVKNLGDGLMVSFGATAPALSCAVEMQQAIERDNRRSPVNLAIRIGISTGDVTEEDGDYFGDPVVEAARLCAAAQGDQILTTDIVKGLARRSGHSFITERELDLKGLPDPVIAWEVVWERAIDDEHARMPLPPRLPVAPAAGFIGRAHERTALDEARKSLAAGEFPCIVLVSGEAGMGKSTLTSSFARAAHHDGAVVLYGRCDEEVAVPYRPFVEALHHCVTHVEDAVLTEIGADHLAALVHLVPALRKRFPHRSPSVASDPDAERWLLFGAVVALVEHVAAEAPVVLVLDDLHWADAPTLQLLRHMAGHLVGRVLVVGTYRDVELSASQPLTQTLAAFARESRVTRLALSGLDDTEVISLMEAAAGHAMDGEGVDLAHALYRETDGNPFFVAEVLRHLVETRAIVQDETGRWVPTRELAAAGLPDSVRQVIGARVARLGEDASRLLSAASVLGQEFEVGVLARMSEAAEDAALDVLEAAESAALVTEVRDAPGRFRFAHALIQHTLYEDLGRSRRARLHRAAGEALEDRLGAASAGPMGEIARHWLAATRPEDPSKAV
ncbi:MAG TPA: AAA family ATPase, partial [Acidimicrobiales bacterium]|nr:AAA family ATPase [Acidimicrobiales bacterium]